MISREEHLKQINRFHDTIENISKEIEETSNDDIKRSLALKYFELTNHLWPKIDTFIEEVKNDLDYSSGMLQEGNSFSYSVAINGHTKTVYVTPLTPKELETDILTLSTIKECIGDKTVKKVIIVPGKLINIVVEDKKEDEDNSFPVRYNNPDSLFDGRVFRVKTCPPNTTHYFVIPNSNNSNCGSLERKYCVNI